MNGFAMLYLTILYHTLSIVIAKKTNPKKLPPSPLCFYKQQKVQENSGLRRIFLHPFSSSF